MSCLCHPDCETLIRRMLVVDPTKRITISQIKQHKWMQADPSLQQQQSLSFSMQNYNSNLGDYNEQVLGIMQTLGIDRQRTVEVRSACPLDTSSVTTRMPIVQSYICHSVTGLDPVSQCSKILTAFPDFYLFLSMPLWVMSFGSLYPELPVTQESFRCLLVSTKQQLQPFCCHLLPALGAPQGVSKQPALESYSNWPSAKAEELRDQQCWGNELRYLQGSCVHLLSRFLPIAVGK